MCYIQSNSDMLHMYLHDSIKFSIITKIKFIRLLLLIILLVFITDVILQTSRCFTEGTFKICHAHDEITSHG